VSIVSTDDLLAMTILLSSPHSIFLRLTVLIKMDHDGSVPSHRDDCMVLSSISNIGNLSILIVMTIQLVIQEA
jgi:hypothetical protein